MFSKHAALERDASATLIDVSIENVTICVLCERLGFSFEVNDVRIDVVFPLYVERAAQHPVASTG